MLANRLSARSGTKVLLLEAGPDTPPGQEPADVLDTYATSYYNDAYFWPGRKTAGLDAFAFIVVLILAGYAMYRVWRSERTYGY